MRDYTRGEGKSICAFGQKDLAHPTLAVFFENVIVRDGRPDHGSPLALIAQKEISLDDKP